MMDKFTISRKKVFVDRQFQTRFILNYLLLIIIGTIIFNSAAYIILDNQLGESLFSAHLAISHTGDMLMPTLIYLSVTFILILGAASVVITLLVSHRISGPLFAIVRYLKMIGEGQLNFEARLRTKDQTAAVAETLTETVRSLGGRITMAKDAVESFKKDLSQVNAYVSQKASGQTELIKAVHDLNEHARVIEERLALFQTE